MTETIPEIIDGADPSLLLLCDHASNHVPDDIDLGIDAALLDKHVGVDIGAAALTRELSIRLLAPAVLATVSRLVIDLHREPDHPGLAPAITDGHDIPGNHGYNREGRIARFHKPYHRTIATEITRHRPSLLVAIHSFTAQMASGGGLRPWQVGVLYNRDDRAARFAFAALRNAGVVTGDNEPYSGRSLNATLNRHGEARGIPCVSLEIRNDLIAEPEGVAYWSDIIEAALGKVRNGLASKGVSAT
ncbi:N-formylglutamate amidohydrolase [Stakelama saccharophila]|uniref:N-formylglutamate amidohydrolase n=1 Tax=Stakelama saccharophila TaxID=3075605 RepID=A0ABZ0B568_9SPHN|nr:N-formylglutamate amidohydrolase [Stakelama sp. W311]WNO52474.1 N-formylglutamate amidohydrolase [Stakelama sp. W311]